MKNKLKIILTGATGMVGEGVLRVCLEDPGIDEVLIITRKPSGIDHIKVKEIIHKDFMDLSPIRERLKGYDACLFCAGISSVGVKEPEYYRVTYSLTIGFAETLSHQNEGLTFCYISGAGTDSSENGRLMWARVKGKTENDLQRLPLRVFNFRPGFMKPRKDMQNTPKAYKFLKWLYPVGRTIYPGGFCTIDELGAAMIHVVRKGYSEKVIEGKQIIELAKKAQ